MNWELRDNSGAVGSVLNATALREAFFRGEITAEDWVRPAGSAQWQQMATVDDFAGAVAGSRRRRVVVAEEDDALDMTPMIDCTFLLLIFFMVTASFHLQKGLDFPPDKTENSKTSTQQLPGLGDFAEHLILEIGQGDRFMIREATAAGSDQTAPGIDPKELVKVLKEQTKGAAKTRVLILPHEMASHEAVVLAIDSCSRAGLRDVSLADVASQTLPASSGGATPIQRN